MLVYHIGRRLFDPQYERLKIAIVIGTLVIVPISGLSVQVSIGCELFKLFYFVCSVALIGWLFNSYTKPVIHKLYTCFERPI